MVREFKIVERDVHGFFFKWSWKSHGKILCQVCGNPAKDVPSQTEAKVSIINNTLLIVSILNRIIKVPFPDLKTV